MINTISTRIRWNDPTSLHQNMDRITELTNIIRSAKDVRMPIREYAAQYNMSTQAFYKYKRKLDSIGIDTGHRKLHYRPTVDNKTFARQNPAPVIQKTEEPHNICVKVNNVCATFSSGISDKALFEIILSLIKDVKESCV